MNFGYFVVPEMHVIILVL